MQVVSNPYQKYSLGQNLTSKNSTKKVRINYVYGFQNQEIDNEIKGNGNSVNYKYRMHDPRVGRFFAVDPLAYKFPHNSPYAFSENRLMDAVEFEGLESVLLSTGQFAPICTNSDKFYTSSGEVKSARIFNTSRADNSADRAVSSSVGFLNKAMDPNSSFSPPVVPNLHVSSRVVNEIKSDPSVAYKGGKLYLKVETKTTILVLNYDYDGNISSISKTKSNRTTYQELQGITSEQFIFKTKGEFKVDELNSVESFDFKADFGGQSDAMYVINSSLNSKDVMKKIDDDLRINSKFRDNFKEIAEEVINNINTATEKMVEKAEEGYSPSSTPPYTPKNITPN